MKNNTLRSKSNLRLPAVCGSQRKVFCLKSLSIAITGISIENRTQTHGKINGSKYPHILYSAMYNLPFDTAGAL